MLFELQYTHRHTSQKDFSFLALNMALHVLEVRQVWSQLPHLYTWFLLLNFLGSATDNISSFPFPLAFCDFKPSYHALVWHVLC